MSFQFSCPAGHRLEAAPSQAGKPTTCPACGATFTVPSLGGPTSPPQPPSVGPPPFQRSTADDQVDRIVRVECPKGHQLETSISSMGDRAACPHCHTVFLLEYDKTSEHREALDADAHARHERFGRHALGWAVLAAMVVIATMLMVALWCMTG